MDTGATKVLPEEYDVLAPDGSEVRVLLAGGGGSMAHFRLPAGQVSRAVRHRTVEEIWYVVSGSGEMWRGAGKDQSFATLAPGVCLTIPVGVAFQFRAGIDVALEAVGVTMPPWPGMDEAAPAEGPWKETANGA
jgi:mannose-6-phosphate isomerase-like protein (cupin superfamily)